MSTREVLEMANYGGDLNLGWKDFISGGVGNIANTKVDYVSSVLAYWDGLEQSSAAAFEEVDEVNAYLADDAEAAAAGADTKAEIMKFVSRAAKVDREALAMFAAEFWDDTAG